MVLWYYDKENRRQGPINPAQFKALVARGIIVPDTIMETEGGKRGKASQIPGAVFPTNVTPPPIPPRTEPVQNQTDQVSNAFPGSYPSDAPLNYSSPDHPTQGGPGSQVEDAFNDILASDVSTGRMTGDPVSNPPMDYRQVKTLPTDDIQYITDLVTWRKNGGLWGWLTDVRFSRIGIQFRIRLILQTFYVLGAVIFGVLGLAGIVGSTIMAFTQKDVPWYIPLMATILNISIFLLYMLVARLLYEFWILVLDFLVTTTQAARKYLNSHRQEP